MSHKFTRPISPRPSGKRKVQRGRSPPNGAGPKIYRSEGLRARPTEIGSADTIQNGVPGVGGKRTTIGYNARHNLSRTAARRGEFDEQSCHRRLRFILACGEGGLANRWRQNCRGERTRIRLMR